MTARAPEQEIDIESLWQEPALDQVEEITPNNFPITPRINTQLPSSDPILSETTAKIDRDTDNENSLSLNVFFGRYLIEKFVSQGRLQIDLFLGNNQIARVQDIRSFVSGLKTALNPNLLLSKSLNIYFRNIAAIPVVEASQTRKLQDRRTSWLLDEFISQKIFTKNIEAARRGLVAAVARLKENYGTKIDFFKYTTDKNPIKHSPSAAPGIRTPVLRRDLPPESLSGSVSVLPWVTDEITGMISRTRIWNNKFSSAASSFKIPVAAAS